MMFMWTFANWKWLNCVCYSMSMDNLDKHQKQGIAGLVFLFLFLVYFYFHG